MLDRLALAGILLSFAISANDAPLIGQAGGRTRIDPASYLFSCKPYRLLR
jgi:hypothetical protein